MTVSDSSSKNAPLVVRGTPSHRATASTSSLIPLLKTNNREDEANMGHNSEPKRINSKHAQEHNDNAPVLAELNLVESEGRVGLRGLFENPLV